MAYNGEQIAAAARALMESAGLMHEGRPDVREAARRANIHRATVYDILRGDKVASETLESFSTIGSEEEALKFLVIAGVREDPVWEDLRGRMSRFTPEAQKQILEFVEKTEAEIRQRKKQNQQNDQ